MRRLVAAVLVLGISAGAAIPDDPPSVAAAYAEIPTATAASSKLVVEPARYFAQYIDPGEAIDAALAAEWEAETARYSARLEAWLAVERYNAEQAQLVAQARATTNVGPRWLHAQITDAILAELRMCESTNNYGINSGNGFRGAVQWLQSTWDAAARSSGRLDLVGVPPNLASPADQDYLTRHWWAVADYRHEWPVCGPRAVSRAG